ncbi:hypothetical protein B0T20DRAFT_347397 [Sordaria brevicollis]|uniref:Uncharacterized protein n=1 Tax=Sordaria brevicollis TaxID=83679 RepID=A0AAE0UEE7_SORBR|nr:hypothetical protein B0T20DRAFT_347397 [Sordaria brevicollis]
MTPLDLTALPLFQLPPELRFMVYRELWTCLVKPDKVYPDDNTESDDASARDEVDSRASSSHSDAVETTDIDEAKIEQFSMLKNLQSLRNTCRKIRDEIDEEFFKHVLSKTQVHLGCADPPRQPAEQSIETDREFFEILRAFSIFTKHVEHVSVHWDGCRCDEGIWQHLGQSAHVLDWLLECEQLRTLEIVFRNPIADNLQFAKGWVPGRVRWGLWREGDDLFCDWCQKKFAQVLATVDKAVGRFWCSAGREGVPAGWRKTVVFRENGQWKETGFFREERNEAEAEEGKNTGAVIKGSPEYRFKYYIGAVDIVWPRMNTL